MTRVISCRVIDPTLYGDGDAETAAAPPAGEQYLISSILPAVDHSVRLPGRCGCGGGFGVGPYNAAGGVPAGLILDTLA